MSVTALVAERGTSEQPVASRNGFLEPLNVLPLDLAPFQTEPIKASRLVRTENLKVQIHGGDFADGTDAAVVALRFGLPLLPMHSDLVLLGRLSRLSSFDAPTVRLFLRKSNLPSNPYRAMNISENRLSDLHQSMALFTMPLWDRICASAPKTPPGIDELLHRLRRPPTDETRTRIAAVAAGYDISAADLADIVEDQADMYLSMRYYADCNTGLGPVVDTVRRSLRRRCGESARPSHGRRAADLLSAVQQRVGENLSDFGAAVGSLWAAGSASEFAQVRDNLETSHRIVGSTVSALAVKINWMYHRFPGWTGAKADGTTDTTLLDLYRSFLDLEPFSGRWAESASLPTAS